MKTQEPLKNRRTNEYGRDYMTVKIIKLGKLTQPVQDIRPLTKDEGRKN